MKKKGILVLLVLLFIVVMIGCKAESQPQNEAPQATESNEVEPTAPIESDEPAAKVGEVQPMAARTNLTQEELMGYFEAAYNAGQIYADLGYDGDSLIEQELKELGYFVEDGTSNWPDDVNVQYLTWRILNHSQEPEATEAPPSNPQPDMGVKTSGGGGTTQTNNGTGGPGGPGGSSGGGGNVDTGSTDEYYNSHQGGDPTQSSIWAIPDDPWDNPGVHIKGYGGD